MTSVNQKKPFMCYVLILLQALLGLGALAGGFGFMVSPNGDAIGIPVTVLTYSPFSNFLIPGIILFVMLGIVPIIIMTSLVKQWSCRAAQALNIYKDMHWAWTYSLYIGFAVIIWITVQMCMLGDVAILHIIYIFLGLIIQMVTLLPSVKRYYQLRNY